MKINEGTAAVGTTLHRRFGVRLACVAAIALTSGSVAGETGDADGAAPDAAATPIHNPAEQESARQLMGPASPGVVVRGADAGDADTSGLPGVAFPVELPPEPELVREGAFVVDRRGILVPLVDGGWAFVFDPTTDGRRDPPMIMQPGRRLAQMVRLVESRPETVTFVVSGQVFVYGKRNYLLARRFSVLAVPADDGGAGADPGGVPDAEAARIREANARLAEPGRDVDPDVDRLLEAIERAGQRGSGLGAGAVAPERAEREDMPALLNEGEMVLSRTGRVVRSSGRGLAFVTDNDADARDTADAPLVLMPCANLEQIERIVRERSDRTRFVISGTVYAYGGSNHLLPTMYIVLRDRAGGLSSAQ